METIKIELTQQDITNILAVISKAPITGAEALTIAQLQIKLSNSLKPENPVKEEKKK